MKQVGKNLVKRFLKKIRHVGTQTRPNPKTSKVLDDHWVDSPFDRYNAPNKYIVKFFYFHK